MREDETDLSFAQFLATARDGTDVAERTASFVSTQKVAAPKPIDFVELAEIPAAWNSEIPLFVLRKFRAPHPV